MTSKVLKSTPRGQITLPKKWREHFSTDHYLVEAHADRLVILPLNVGKPTEEEIVFDADRDNHGKGIPAREMIRLIQKINHEQD
jgi:bifunctional DNA-binding transcriptional regulator/antitoxin component of YhaV-PrlF toxin-antitoxin module